MLAPNQRAQSEQFGAADGSPAKVMQKYALSDFTWMNLWSVRFGECIAQPLIEKKTKKTVSMGEGYGTRRYA